MPKKGSSNACNELLVRAREAENLAAVLEILGEAKDKILGAAPLTTALNILATKAAADTEGRASETLQAAEALFQAAVAHNSGKLSESLVTVMVRICCAVAAPQRALALVEEAAGAGTKPKLRTLAAILAQAADAGDRATCDGVWSRLAELQLEPQDTEYAAMLRSLRGDHSRQLDIIRQLLVELPLPSDPPLVEELGLTFGVRGVAELMGADPSYADGLEADGGRWKVGWTSVDPSSGACALSTRRLQALDVAAEEEEELLTWIAKLANDSSGFRLFRRWLSEQQPYDVIIDGANVGFNNQNHDEGHFQYDQIDTMVQHFRRNGQRILLVLHPKWLKEDADLKVIKRKRRKFDQISSTEAAPVERECEAEEGDADVVYPHEGITDAEREAATGTPLSTFRTWKEGGVLLTTPFYDCDDWYWLYAALDSFRRGHKHVQVVSNDHMRDHHWRMFSSRAFLRWQERHMTRFSIQSEASDPGNWKLHLSPPRPFSLRAQVSADGRAWHFPVPAIRSRAEQLSSGRPLGHREVESAEHRWLVAWRNT